MLMDPVAQPASFKNSVRSKAAGCSVIDILHGGEMAQLGGPGACLEALLLPQGHLVLEQDAEPLHMVEESTAFRVGHQIAQAPWPCPPGRARAGGRSSDAAATSFSSMVVAGTADIGVQDRRAVRGARRRLGLEPMLEDGGDTLVIERAAADLDRGADGDRLRSDGINAAIEAQDAEASAEALLRMWPPGQHGDDQRLGVGTDRAEPGSGSARGSIPEYSRCALGMWSGKVPCRGPP